MPRNAIPEALLGTSKTGCWQTGVGARFLIIPLHGPQHQPLSSNSDGVVDSHTPVCTTSPILSPSFWASSLILLHHLVHDFFQSQVIDTIQFCNGPPRHPPAPTFLFTDASLGIIFPDLQEEWQFKTHSVPQKPHQVQDVHGFIAGCWYAALDLKDNYFHVMIISSTWGSVRGQDTNVLESFLSTCPEAFKSSDVSWWLLYTSDTKEYSSAHT